MAEDREHVVPPSIYVAVLTALMVLLALTLITAFVDLDRKFGAPYLNMSVAVLIAIVKAVLIILFFMHVKYSSRLTWAFAGAAFVWLGIMLTLSMSDYVTRGPSPTPRTGAAPASPQIIRPPPRQDSVVGDAGNLAPAPSTALASGGS